MLTVNVTLFAPAGTVTLEGTVATFTLLLVSVTTEPTLGAGPVRVAVPVEDVPPVTVDGLRVIEDRVGALTVKVVDLVVP